MAAPRLTLSERLARGLVLTLLLAVVAAAGWGWWTARHRGVEVHALMPERGGFHPDHLTVRVGEPLHLRLVSDDVVHGFAVGGRSEPEVMLYPGQPQEVTLTFDRPGTYTFYCTVWCGPNHWRMRGTITVLGPLAEDEPTPVPPLYVRLGLDLDAPHPAPAVPEGRPSAVRGATWAARLPAAVRTVDFYRTHSPAEAWRILRQAPELADLSDGQVWDVVAFLWREATTPQALAEGQRLYQQQCAACHGTTGRGDGPFAHRGSPQAKPDGHSVVPPPDFTDPAVMFGASPALLQGKILRGGMGTGMPSWGLIYTEEQTWALVSYLWTMSLDLTSEAAPSSPEAGPTP